MEFQALAISEGDAFLYKRDGKTALIDGGKNETQAKDLLIGLGIQKIDYLICTHNDKDHTGGIIGILKERNIQIGELWIPDTWEQASRQLEESSINSLLNDLIGHYKKPFKETNKDLNNEIDDVSNEELVNEENLHSESLEKLIEVQKRLPCPLYRCPICKKANKLVNSAKNIVKIRDLAKNNNIPTHLFQFQQDPCSVKGHGIPDFLICLNGNRVKQPLKNNIDIGNLIELTLTNEESLIFFSPQEKNNPAVLFSSDSYFDTFATQFTGTPSKIIITAPHHGAAENGTAYSKVYSTFSTATRIWIRSDKFYEKRPACWFKLTPDLKFCTQCNDSQLSKNLMLTLKSNLNVSHLRPCSCICYIRNNKSPRTTNKDA